MTQHIHIANKTSEPIYVASAPQIGWAIAENIFARFKLGVSVATKSPIGMLLGSINTVVTTIDLINAASFQLNEAKQQLEEIKKFLDDNAIKINPGNAVDVLDTNLWNPTNLKYWGDLFFNASNTSLFIATTSFSRRVAFNTNSDYSWIVKDNEIVRAQYGKLSVEDRNSGFYRFPKGDQLVAGQSLLPDECISSVNGDYDFVYQKDGNAVVYKRDKPSSEKPVWSSNTYPSAGAVRMQSDGHLVIYDASNKPVGASRKFGQGEEFQNSRLVMQDDGNLVAYTKSNNVIWARTYDWYKGEEKILAV